MTNQNAPEAGSESSAVVRLRTPLGSTVILSGKHRGRVDVEFDWLEEDPACIDCEVDIDASRDTNWTTLIWGCCECTGGQAPLEPVDA